MRKVSFDLRQKMSQHPVTRAVQQPGEVDDGNATRAAKQPGQQPKDQQVEASKRYKRLPENQDRHSQSQATNSESDSEDSNKRYWDY